MWGDVINIFGTSLRAFERTVFASQDTQNLLNVELFVPRQLENAGGAAKTHSIPPLVENKDDYQKTSKYPSTSTHSETSLQVIKQCEKYLLIYI